MTSARLIQLIGLLGLAACLTGAALLTGPIEQQRRDLQLATIGANPAGQAPPLFNVMIAAGGPLRGAAISILWMQAEKLKEEGRFFALAQMCDYMSELQPNYPKTWGTMAWNLAYNVSVMTKTQEERWYWVNTGVNLLRNRGILCNPTAIDLYDELGRMFIHKIGGNSDDAHYYYKYRLAYEWQEILGEPDPSLSDPEQIASFGRVAQAPDTLEALLQSSPDVGPLLDRLRAIGRKPGEALLREVGRIAMFNHAADIRFLGLDVADQPGLYGRDLVDLLRVLTPVENRALEQLLNYLRRRVLIDAYHMDPQFMWELMRPGDPARGVRGYDLGPLDFRAAGAHACYWSALGVAKGAALQRKDDLEMRNTYRQVLHALKQLMEEGRISLHPVPPGQEKRFEELAKPLAAGPGQVVPTYVANWSLIDLSPDVRFIAAYGKAFEAVAGPDSGLDPGDQANYMSGRQNFLLNAMVYLYLYGRPEDARRYYEQARADYAQQDPQRYNKPMLDLIVDVARQSGGGMADTRQFVLAMMFQAINEGLRQGRPDVYARYLEMARKTYLDYQRRTVATPMSIESRQSLGVFDAMLTDLYGNYLLSPNLPLLVRARVWANTPPTFPQPPTLPQRVYDDLKPILIRQCREAKLDPARAFPEPPGMDALRKPPKP